MWRLAQSTILTLSPPLPLPSGGRNEEGEEEEEDKGKVDISVSMTNVVSMGDKGAETNPFTNLCPTDVQSLVSTAAHVAGTKAPAVPSLPVIPEINLAPRDPLSSSAHQDVDMSIVDMSIVALVWPFLTSTCSIVDSLGSSNQQDVGPSESGVVGSAACGAVIVFFRGRRCAPDGVGQRSYEDR